MEFPDDVLRLIKEYSQPITRPDWRSLHHLTLSVYMNNYLENLKKRHYIDYDKFLQSNRVYTLHRYYKLFGRNLSF